MLLMCTLHRRNWRRYCIMNNIKQLIMSIFIASLTTLSITFVAQAVSAKHIITETNLTFVNGISGNPSILLQSPSCLNQVSGGAGYCKYRIGSTTSVNTYRWDYTTAHTYQIWAFDPTIGESVAKYSWRDINIWNSTVDQSNAVNKGKWVYIGYSDYVSTNTGGYLMLSNDCSGWTCGKKVLFDSMEYNTNP